PPAPVILASSIGAGAPASLTRSTTRITGSGAGGAAGASASIFPVVPAAAAVVMLGRTVTIPRPSVNPEVVISFPPNTFISTDGPASVQSTATALTRTPNPVIAETAPARSRPSAPAPTKIASGGSLPTSARSASEPLTISLFRAAMIPFSDG